MALNKLFSLEKKREWIKHNKIQLIKALNTTQLDYYKLNPKNITHAASMPEKKTEKKRERGREKD